MKKKILLLAYTNKNFGDDMFVKTICELNKDVNFYIEAPTEYKAIFSCIENLHVIAKTPLYKVLNRVENLICKVFNLNEKPFRHIWLRKFDAVVYVIGALFDEDDLWEKALTRLGLEKYKRNQWLNSFYGDIPFFLLGCNMTRMRSKKYLDTMCCLFEGLTDICFRDRYSYEAFSQLSNTRYAPDIVFNYPVSVCEKKNFVLISVWGVLLKTDSWPQWKWAEPLWHGYKRLITDATAYFLSEGIPVKLVSLCENEGDLLACQKIAEDFQSDLLEIVNYRGNLDEMIHLFETAGFAVGSRFHSVVMALKTNTPVYPIAYESKTKQLLNDLDYRGNYAEIESLDNCNVEDIIQSYNLSYVHDCTTVENMAGRQFQKLELLLKE